MAKRTKKGFDAVAWMRRRRAEIDREDQGLTWEEKSRKTLAVLEGDPLWERLKHRALERTVIASRRGGNRQER